MTVTELYKAFIVMHVI